MSAMDAGLKKITDNLEAMDEEKHKSRWDLFRLGTKQLLERTWIGGMYAESLLFVSVISCFEYIYQTYPNPSWKNGSKILEVCSYLELVFAGLFGLDWIFQMIIADNSWTQFIRYKLHTIILLILIVNAFSFFSVVDLMTVVSTFVIHSTECPQVFADSTFYTIVEYIFCAMGTVRILRALRFKKKFEQMEDEVQRFLANMSMNMIVMILFSEWNSVHYCTSPWLNISRQTHLSCSIWNPSSATAFTTVSV